jgi:hypothetical protein
VRFWGKQSRVAGSRALLYPRVAGRRAGSLTAGPPQSVPTTVQGFFFWFVKINSARRVVRFPETSPASERVDCQIFPVAVVQLWMFDLPFHWLGIILGKRWRNLGG